VFDHGTAASIPIAEPSGERGLEASLDGKTQDAHSLTFKEAETILGNKIAVRPAIACRLIKVRDRQLRNLIKAGKLTKTPQGLVTSESLRSHLGIGKENRQRSAITGSDRQ
jgi:hypothetical protein